MKILQNAVDAIEIGLEDYKMNDPRRAKSSLRNISAGLLLLFKEKLQRMSPNDSDDVLIKQTIRPILGDDGEWSFQGSGKKTVDVQQIKDRFGGLRIQVDWRAFDQINNLRNNIEHYYTDRTASVVNEVVSKSFKIIRDFSKTYLDIEVAELLGQKSWEVFLEVEEVYEKEKEESLESLKLVNWGFSSLSSAMEHVRCTECSSELIQAAENQSYTPGSPIFLNCKKCGNEFVIDDVLEECLEEEFGIEAHIAVIDGGDMPYAECPECLRATYIFQEGCCLACGYKQINKECYICGTSLDLEEGYDSAMCYGHRELMEKDD